MSVNQVSEKVVYDNFGRMQYHPDYHPNQGKPYSEEDLIYLCKFWEYDHRQTVAMALGRTEHTLASKVYTLRKAGKFDYYKNKEWKEVKINA